MCPVAPDCETWGYSARSTRVRAGLPLAGRGYTSRKMRVPILAVFFARMAPMFIHRPRGSANPAVKQRLFDAPRVYTAANAHSFRKERDKEWGTRTPQNQKAQECRLRKAWPAPAQAAQSVYKGRHREWTQKRRVIVQF